MSLPTREYDEVLAHHGVMGMHWGVRKAKPPAVEVPHIVAHPDHPMGKPHPATLSNAELQQRVQRMNMEQQYSRLAGDTIAVAAGTGAVAAILANYKMANEFYKLAHSPMSKTIAAKLSGTAGKIGRRIVTQYLPI